MPRNAAAFRLFTPEVIPTLVTGLGGVFLFVYAAEQFVLYPNASVTSPGFVVGLVVSGVFMGMLLGGGHWLERSTLSTERYPRILKWIAGGLVFFLLVNLMIIAVWTPPKFAFAFSWGRWAANVGAAAGLLVGFVEARAIQRELQAQRAAIRAEEAENQRRSLDYLNGLLRHEVLNTANVITGYASLALEDGDVDDATETHLETIHRHGEEMANVIRDVRVLIEATEDDPSLTPTDLSDVLTEELERVSTMHESVTVEASIPDRLSVEADDLLPRLFSNLFQNAVQHNDADTPQIRVTAERDDGAVRVRIADNGPGVPTDQRAILFERSNNTGATHGLGLYLVRTLAERYGGTVELSETGDGGSTFTVRLPTAEPADATERGPAVPIRS